MFNNIGSTTILSITSNPPTPPDVMDQFLNQETEIKGEILLKIDYKWSVDSC